MTPTERSDIEKVREWLDDYRGYRLMLSKFASWRRG